MIEQPIHQAVGEPPPGPQAQVKIVRDTNVLTSAIFFGGAPGEVLDAWRDERVQLVTSAEIIEEYIAVGEELSRRYPALELDTILALIINHTDVYDSPPLERQVCSDPADDKFLACDIAGGTKTVVSGDKALRKVSGYRGIRIIGPREFVTDFL